VTDVSDDVIELRDLRVSAFCGVLPEETTRRQPFAFDLDVHIDLAAAAVSDDLADTVDYGALCGLVAGIAAAERFSLLERFAGRVAEAREILGEDMLIGYSAHSAAEAADAFEQGASYVSLSPVFLPLSKTGEFQPLGLEELGRACSSLPGPGYALGGVTSAAASSIKDMGAAGVAVITAILEADDPAGVSRRIQAPWGDRATG
jgi:FolB domain-containing protein